MQRPILAELLDKGLLRPPQIRAGLEAALVYEAITACIAARVSRYGEASHGFSLAEWPPALQRAAGRYRAWAEWAASQVVTPRCSRVELVQDVAIDGLGLSRVRRKRGLHSDTVLRHLQIGLWQYAALAGWVSEADRAV
ncbi:hypothetical protein [Teichococcus vastitatis]|uniref:Uncharacterized protein n=1 Tax=Teichococcus vastitatis TaxID=2307076 RepID=A0ABS9WAF7_9PROT|nr:hypothetical protein [Pseudoroseomonas vastitatis]MCI0755745.1 hypothetical protein [Pseudoroseomonas vastitatis]